MKKRLLRLAGVLGIACLAGSCTTTYDAYGRPVETVTPEGAAIAAVAAGFIGYAIADGNNHGYYRNHGCRSRGSYGHGGRGYRRGGSCY